MPDAWEILYNNSSLLTGDAWEHLNAQEGGSGSLVLFDGLEVEMDDRCLEVELELEDASLVDDAIEYDVEIEPLDFEIEVC